MHQSDFKLVSHTTHTLSIRQLSHTLGKIVLHARLTCLGQQGQLILPEVATSPASDSAGAPCDQQSLALLARCHGTAP